MLGVAVLALVTVDGERELQGVRVGDLVSRDDHRAERAVGILALGEEPLARATLIARTDVVDDAGEWTTVLG